ncbi:MAG: hypothetical protein HYU36_06400 [Planctomycetes bacterium]|nr:hypothetical protein [Planctomycetota bacterium]
MNRSFTWLLFFALALPVFIHAETPGRSGPAISARYWLGQRLRPGRWNTIVVDIENGDQECRGLVTYLGGNEGEWKIEKRVEAPSKAHVRLPFYVVPHLSEGDLFFTPEGKKKPQPIHLACLGVTPDDRNVMGLLGARSLSLLPDNNQEQPLWTMLPLREEEMPDEARGYDALDVLVWSDPDVTVLTPARMDALEQWVRGGGNLIVIPGERWRDLALSPLARLLPSLPRDRRDETDWREVREMFTGPLLQQWLAREKSRAPNDRHSLFADSALSDELGDAGHVEVDPVKKKSPAQTGSASRWRLSRAEARALWDKGRFGFGRVAVLGFNPTEPYFADVPDLFFRLYTSVHGRRFKPLREVEAGPIAVPAPRQGKGVESCWSALGHFDAVQSIGFESILLYLGVYVLLLGPVDYLVLKWLGRLEWTWLTFSLIVALAVSLAVSWAIGAKGRRFLSNSVTVLDLVPGTEDGIGHEWVTVFSPLATSMEISHPAPGSAVLPADLGRYSGRWRGSQVSESAGARLVLAVGQWSVASFYTHFLRKDAGRIQVRRSDNDKKEFLLQNATPFHFKRYWLLWPDGTSLGAKPLESGSQENLGYARTSLPFVRGRDIDPGEELHWVDPRLNHFVKDSLSTRQRSWLNTGRSLGSLAFHHFTLPEEIGSGQVLFLGLTESEPSAYQIQGVDIVRDHLCLIRAIMDLEAADDRD